MLAQNRAAASVLERKEGQRVGTPVTGIGKLLDMPEGDISVPLASLYDGVLDA